MKLSTFVLSSVAAAALAVSALALPTVAAEMTVTVGDAPMYPSKNIIQNAVNSKDHTTLVAAVKAAGLVDTLSSPVLTYHVVPGRYTAKDIMDMIKKDGGKTMLKTVEGEELSVLWVWDAKGDAAKITIKNVMQSNGVIHVIDTVLLHG